jgi:uncharacterized membrane protein YgcG
MRIAFFATLLLLCVSVATAQGTCPEIVQQALQSIDRFCQSTQRNQACFGNVALTAEPQPGAAAFKFDQVGDITDVAGIRRMELAPMDTAAGAWGLVLMQLQADLPNTMPGQNVTFVLFGDVTLENATTPGQTPMQAFYLNTGIGDAPCAEAPASGVLVQTPQGVGQVAFNVNGVDVQMGSTVKFQSRPGEQMIVRTLEGSAVIEVDGVEQLILQGMEFSAPIDDDFNLDTAAAEIGFYAAAEIEALPLQLLEREIEAEVLTEAEFAQIAAALAEGAALCSDEADAFLPPCSDVPAEFGGAACVYAPSAAAPLCPEANPCAYLPAEAAALCEQALLEAIAAGDFATGLDFTDPCAFVPAEYAADCRAAVDLAIETGILPAFPDVVLPDESTGSDDSGSSGGGSGDAGGSTGGSGGTGGGSGDDDGGDADDSSGDDGTGGDSGGDEGGSGGDGGDSGEGGDSGDSGAGGEIAGDSGDSGGEIVGDAGDGGAAGGGDGSDGGDDGSGDGSDWLPGAYFVV